MSGMTFRRTYRADLPGHEHDRIDMAWEGGDPEPETIEVSVSMLREFVDQLNDAWYKP